MARSGTGRKEQKRGLTGVATSSPSSSSSGSPSSSLSLQAPVAVSFLMKDTASLIHPLTASRFRPPFIEEAWSEEEGGRRKEGKEGREGTAQPVSGLRHGRDGRGEGACEEKGGT